MDVVLPKDVRLHLIRLTVILGEKSLQQKQEINPSVPKLKLLNATIFNPCA